MCPLRRPNGYTRRFECQVRKRYSPDNFNMEQSATDFPKRATTTTTTDPSAASPPVPAKTPIDWQKATINPSKSTVKADVFYKDQSQLATSFPKRTPAHAAPVPDVQPDDGFHGPSISSGVLL